MSELNQQEVNRIGGELEGKITKVILEYKASRESIAGTICALASVICYVGISAYGEKDAPEMISAAINNALNRTNKLNKLI